MNQEIEIIICDNCGQEQEQTKAVLEETDTGLFLFCSAQCRNKFITGK